ncbi:MAG: hypothetical protein ACPGUV_08410 [Polyangiales bacterium]
MRSFEVEPEDGPTASAFRPILRRLMQALDDGVAVIFVDDEGEVVDRYARVDVIEADIVGATLVALLAAHVGLRRCSPWGAVHTLHLHTSRWDFAMRPVADAYFLVTQQSRRPRRPGSLEAALERCAASLAQEAGLCLPPDDPATAQVQVRLQPAQPWGYAPAAYCHAGDWHALHAVSLAPDADGASDVAHYAAMDDNGNAVLLAHDKIAGCWRLVTATPHVAPLR